MTRLTPGRVRSLTAADLELDVPEEAPAATAGGAGTPDDLVALPSDDPILEQVTELLKHYGGVIFTGPPGTSKSWYAARVGITLVGGDRSRLRFVQFHPSYQYEDFVQGFVPKDTGDGFVLKPKHLLEMCKMANDEPDRPAVLVIDELSRGEPGRVFGEALTYVEKTKRGFPFRLASGAELAIPPNLVFLATMNPQDRGVDEVDAAFERRFARIAMEPDAGLLLNFLATAGMPEPLRDRVLTFFRTINEGKKASNPFAALGHTFFEGASDLSDLRRIWDHQLRFLFDKAFRIDPDGLADVHRAWNRMLQVPVDDEDDFETEADTTEPAEET